MKPLPSPSRASAAASSGFAHFSRTERDYNPSVYAGNALQTSTFASVRSLPSAPASFRSQLAPQQQQLQQQQLQRRDSGGEQHFDDMLQTEYMQASREQYRPASPADISNAEAAALKLELQVPPLRSAACVGCAVSPFAQQETSKVAQLQQQLKALQARRPSPERAAASKQPPPQLRTAADIAAHEEVRALQAALASAHSRNAVLEASA
jgi:hypothetical protein